MSALGITFTVGALSWLIGRISAQGDIMPERNPLAVTCGFIFLGSLIAGIVQIGMML
jgi:hypothetical protein